MKGGKTNKNNNGCTHERLLLSWEIRTWFRRVWKMHKNIAVGIYSIRKSSRRASQSKLIALTIKHVKHPFLIRTHRFYVRYSTKRCGYVRCWLTGIEFHLELNVQSLFRTACGCILWGWRLKFVVMRPREYRENEVKSPLVLLNIHKWKMKSTAHRKIASGVKGMAAMLA